MNTIDLKDPEYLALVQAYEDASRMYLDATNLSREMYQKIPFLVREVSLYGKIVHAEAHSYGKLPECNQFVINTNQVIAEFIECHRRQQHTLADRERAMAGWQDQVTIANDLEKPLEVARVALVDWVNAHLAPAGSGDPK